MAIGCRLEAAGKYTAEELEILWCILPSERVNKCDGLNFKVVKAFERELFLIDDKFDCVRIGVASLVEYMSQERRPGRAMSVSDLRMVEKIRQQYLVEKFQDIVVKE